MPGVTVRPVEAADVEAIRAIYAPIVEASHISFELEVPSREEMVRRVAEYTERLPWLVVVDNDQVMGYAYAAPHGDRGAYRWAVDTSIYLDPGIRGRGIGTILYTDLLERLRTLGYVSAFAGVALPNPASVALHQRVGFLATGSFPVAGFKLGRWIDVSLWRCGLADLAEEPIAPAMWRSRNSSTDDEGRSTRGQVS